MISPVATGTICPEATMRPATFVPFALPASSILFVAPTCKMACLRETEVWSMRTSHADERPIESVPCERKNARKRTTVPERRQARARAAGLVLGGQLRETAALVRSLGIS